MHYHIDIITYGTAFVEPVGVTAWRPVSGTGWSKSPASAADWFNEGRSMCYHVYVIMHVKDPITKYL